MEKTSRQTGAEITGRILMKKQDLKYLLEKGFHFAETKGQYEEARLKGPCTIILYNTGKLVVQGKEKPVRETKKLLGLPTEKKQEVKKMIGVVVGSDETLKGDTFGGIIVAGFRADDEERKKLQRLGVEDSKNLTDKNIEKVAESIKNNFSKDNYHIIELTPKEYNNETIMGNSTLLLNRLHKQVNEKLKTANSKQVVDKYPGCRVGDIIETKAESSYLEVAAASILARQAGIKQFQNLSRQAGFTIPKGSTHVKKALKELKQSNLDMEDFVKMKFSNVQKIFS